MLREQWIRAKYERKEFTEPGKQLPYTDGKSRAQLQNILLVALPEAFECYEDKAHCVSVANPTGTPENLPDIYKAWLGESLNCGQCRFALP